MRWLSPGNRGTALRRGCNAAQGPEGPEQPSPAQSAGAARPGAAPAHPAEVLDIAFQATHLSGALSAPVAGREKEKADDLGEDGGTAGSQTLGAVGDCGLSHWTIDGRVWLGLKVEV